MLRRSLRVAGFWSLVFITSSIAAAQPVVVTPDDLAGWLIGPFGAPPTAEFVDGPGAPPLGNGSYRTQIAVAGSKIILGRNDYHGALLSDLTAFSYWTYVDPGASNLNNWYVNLYLDADDDGMYETRLDYVPPPAQVTTGVWQSWDAMAGDWIVNPGGATTSLADFLTANPNARFNAFDNPLALAVRFNMGDTAASYVGFDGNLDGVRIAVGGVGDGEWDFERVQSVVAIPTLSGIGLVAVAVALLAAGLLFVRRRTAG